MSTIFCANTAGDPTHYHLQVGTTVQAMRRSLDVTVAELARASGIPHRSLAAIEGGGATTRAQRHDIAVALGWLSTNRVAKGSAKLMVPGGSQPVASTEHDIQRGRE